MKLFFSEHQSNYESYIYDYAIWAFPEEGEKPSDIMEKGFLPASLMLDRFYLCRNIRVSLEEFKPSSENRRIKRKGEGISCQLIKREDFDFNQQRQDFCHDYAEKKWGQGVMDYDRLNRTMSSPVISDVLVFSEAGKEIGYVAMYTEGTELAYYYYSFYDLKHPFRSLGMFMMISAIEYFKEQSLKYIYLGTCYSRKATYKTQFVGVSFFNGYKWSRDIGELKYLVDRQEKEKPSGHLLDTPHYINEYHDGDLGNMVSKGGFKVDPNA